MNAIISNDSLFSDREQRAKIIWFLKAVPYIKYTSNGITNIARRFGVSPEHLTVLVEFVQEKGGWYGN